MNNYLELTWFKNAAGKIDAVVSTRWSRHRQTLSSNNPYFKFRVPQIDIGNEKCYTEYTFFKL